MKRSKKRCWACGHLASIKWGKQKRKQRYKCKNCGIIYTAKNKGSKSSNE